MKLRLKSKVMMIMVMTIMMMMMMMMMTAAIAACQQSECVYIQIKRLHDIMLLQLRGSLWKSQTVKKSEKIKIRPTHRM